MMMIVHQLIVIYPAQKVGWLHGCHFDTLTSSTIFSRLILLFDYHNIVRVFSLSKNCYMTRMAMSSCGILEKQTVVGSHEENVIDSHLRFQSPPYISIPASSAALCYSYFSCGQMDRLTGNLPKSKLIVYKKHRENSMPCRNPTIQLGEGGGCSSTSWDDPIRWNACFLPIHPEKDSMRLPY
jgi:hypothetical protein